MFEYLLDKDFFISKDQSVAFEPRAPQLSYPEHTHIWVRVYKLLSDSALMRVTISIGVGKILKVDVIIITKTLFNKINPKFLST